MSTKKTTTTEKKTVKEKFLKLWKNVPLFMTSKEKAAKYFEKKKAEAKIMMDAVKELQRTSYGTIDDSVATYEGDEKEEIYLYDFISEYGGGIMNSRITTDGVNLNLISGTTSSGSDPTSFLISSEIEAIPPKLTLKPIDVWKELETIPAPVTLENLEEKIAVLNMKKDFIKGNRYAKKEVIDMITRLENRRQYDEFKEYFEQYDNTTTDKINALVNKYELVLRTSDLFIPKFPKEAMDIMTSYKANVKKLCKKSPVFYVIAEKEMFNDEYKRNDPILLVQSPFGIYWQILGAWDKELVLLEEL